MAKIVLEKEYKIQSFFPAEEYKARCRKAQEKMGNMSLGKECKGLDALLLTSDDNVSYFTGFRRYFPSEDRVQFFLLPKEGEPVFLQSTVFHIPTKVIASVEDVRVWGGEPSFGNPVDPIIAIEAILREKKLDSKRIGMEFGWNMRIDMGLEQLEELKRRLPNAQFVDGSDVVWQCRMIKSPLELGVIRNIAKINCKAFKRAFEVLKQGVTKKEMVAEVMKSYIEEGADEGYLNPMQKGMFIVRGGPERYPSWGPYRDIKYKKGDQLFLDGGPWMKGYFSDLQRIVNIGEPNDRQKKLAEIGKKANLAAYKLLKPGTRAGDVYKAAKKVVREMGHELYTERIGHGIGLQLHEQPNMHPNEDTILQPGMTLCLEIGVLDYPKWDVFGMYMEDEFIITEDGHECISEDLPFDLIVI